MVVEEWDVVLVVESDAVEDIWVEKVEAEEDGALVVDVGIVEDSEVVDDVDEVEVVVALAALN